MAKNWCLLLACAMIQWGASGFELRITPKRAHITINSRLKIMCQADVPITACQFKRTFATVVYDLSNGSASTVHPDYNYYGVGLEHGQCGIDLREYIKDHTYDLIGCRVKAEDGVWRYSYMSLVVNSNESPIYNMEPRETVVLAGSNLSVLCRAGEELSTCQMKWASQGWTALTSSKTPGANFAYYGAGINKGQCGVTFINVTDKINGDVFCAGWTKAKPKGYESDTTVVIVAKAPDMPVLLLDKNLYNESDVMLASCYINNSRPVSNITWFLDADVLRNDSVDQTTDDAMWRWSYDLQEITQYVRRTLTWEDDGKELVCRAGHVALLDGFVDVRQSVRVQYRPRPKVDLPSQQVSVGEAVTVTMLVQANPKPSFSWQLGTLIIEEGMTGDEDRITASVGKKVDGGWEATLIISILLWNDTDSDGVILTASNTLGECSYTIPFSTSSSPDVDYSGSTDASEDSDDLPVDGRTATNEAHKANNESGNNGVVVGVSLFIVVVAVLVGVAYARFKRKWCFQLHRGGVHFTNSICADEEEDNCHQNVDLDIRQP